METIWAVKIDNKEDAMSLIEDIGAEHIKRGIQPNYGGGDLGILKERYAWFRYKFYHLLRYRWWTHMRAQSSPVKMQPNEFEYVKYKRSKNFKFIT